MSVALPAHVPMKGKPDLEFDGDLGLESDSGLEESAASWQTTPPGGRLSRGLLAGLGLLATACVAAAVLAALGARAPAPPGAGAARGPAVVSLAEASGGAMGTVTYGLEEAPCPSDTSDRSQGAKVTLPAIKKLLGAELSDEVEFWWVYPNVTEAKEKHPKNSAKAQFKTFGGYLYKWSSKMKCLAMTPFGNRLKFQRSSDLPEGKLDWHKPYGQPQEKAFAWYPPSDVCPDGCFIYEFQDGTKEVMHVAK